MKIYRVLLAICLISQTSKFSLAPGMATAAEPINIGSRLELFVDDYLIDALHGAELRLHPPIPREVVIEHDAPWEGNVSAYHTVFQDGEYRMYYRGAHYDEGKSREAHPQFVCYAESKDGIHWVKPELGIVEFNKSKQNNIVWNGVGAHNFAPFKDDNPNCSPKAKYKAVGSGKGGLYAFQSPDGIHWSQLSKQPVITKGAFDSQNLAFWDSHRRRYVDFHRGFRDDRRDIMTSTSTDFLKWTEPEWIEYTGAPPEHLYTNQIVPYFRAPHIFMGFPKRFTPSRNPAQHRYGGVSDGVFMTSRDGKNFRRWSEAFIRPGLQEDRWVNRNNMTAWGIVVTPSDFAGAPNELSIYSTEGYYRGKSSRLRRFTVRTDGFVSVQAPLSGGELITKPFTFVGKELVINYSTSGAGSLRVELQNAEGNPIPGRSLDRCAEIYGDHLERVVKWKGRGNSDLSELAGQPVRLRFELSDADLYSMRFK